MCTVIKVSSVCSSLSHRVLKSGILIALVFTALLSSCASSRPFEGRVQLAAEISFSDSLQSAIEDPEYFAKRRELYRESLGDTMNVFYQGDKLKITTNGRFLEEIYHLL